MFNSKLKMEIAKLNTKIADLQLEVNLLKYPFKVGDKVKLLERVPYAMFSYVHILPSIDNCEILELNKDKATLLTPKRMLIIENISMLEKMEEVDKETEDKEEGKEVNKGKSKRKGGK